MNSCKGYYSIIQYCPDISRLEVANIGVLLLVPELRFFQAKMSRNNYRAQRIFGRESYDNNWLKKTKAMFAERVKAEAAVTFEDFKHFIDTRMNNVILTTPKPVRVHDAEETLVMLFSEVVDIEQAADTEEQIERIVSPAYERLNTAFHEHRFEGLIQRGRKIDIPGFHDAIEAPFAYQNGSLNLIKPQLFKRQSVKKESSLLSMEGLYLHREQVAELTVIPESEEEETQEIALAILRTAGVRIVLPNDIGAFVERVAAEAHK